MTDEFDDFEIPDFDGDVGDIPDSSDPVAGTYLCKIKEMEMKGRKGDSAKKFIQIQFEIVDVLDESLVPFIGRSIWDIFNLGEDSLWKIKGVWTACRGKENAKGKRIPNLTNETLKLDAFVDSYQGRENLRTRKYQPAAGWSGMNMEIPDDGIPTDDEDKPADPAPPSTTKAPAAQNAGEVEI